MIHNEGELIKLVESTNKKLNEMGSGWEGPQGEKGHRCDTCEDRGYYSNKLGDDFVCDCEAGNDVTKATGIPSGEKMPEYTGDVKKVNENPGAGFLAGLKNIGTGIKTAFTSAPAARMASGPRMLPNFGKSIASSIPKSIPPVAASPAPASPFKIGLGNKGPFNASVPDASSLGSTIAKPGRLSGSSVPAAASASVAPTPAPAPVAPTPAPAPVTPPESIPTTPSAPTGPSYMDRFRNVVKAHPVTAVGGAALGGAVVGGTLARKRRP